jgi:ABC-2 type transport system permease protein
MEVDATDPAASGFALGAFTQLAQTALRDDLVGPLKARAQTEPPFTPVTHLLYNPESNTQYSIVPGLLAIILTMTMVLMTCLALTRERERGTYENLLAMPATPLEIMIGKIAPNVVVGVVQSAIVLAAAKYVFGVPVLGSLWLLGAALTLYIIANLAVGYTFSTIAQNQLQAMQMTTFFLLPAILLSGFAFPFAGMPTWAQWLGEVLPATHFLRIARGILLKGNGIANIAGELWPLLLFTLVVGTIALLRFRRTLD